MMNQQNRNAIVLTLFLNKSLHIYVYTCVCVYVWKKVKRKKDIFLSCILIKYVRSELNPAECKSKDTKEKYIFLLSYLFQHTFW